MKAATGSRHPGRLGRRDPRRGIVRRSLACATTRAPSLGFGLRCRRSRHRRVPCICRPHHLRLVPICLDRVFLRTGLHGARQARLRQIGRVCVRRAARSRGHQPPFLEVPPVELGREAMRPPLGRPLLRVSQQGSLDELLLGQHGLCIGTWRSRTSIGPGGEVRFRARREAPRAIRPRSDPAVGRLRVSYG